jgi:arginyl-tRNA synthetase
MSLELQIKQSIQSILSSEFDITEAIEKIALAPTRKEVAGDFTFVVFPYAGRSKTTPEKVAEVIGSKLKEQVGEVSGFNVIKGFLNIELSSDAWLDKLKEVFETEDYGKNTSISSKVMVEYSSPNTNKPLHLGHLRNNFLGYSVSQILKYNGADLTMANLINDRGIHICKSMLAYQKFGNGETPESSGLKGDKLVGKYYVEFDLALKAELKEMMAKGISEDEAKKTAPLMLAAQQMLLDWESGNKEVHALWSKMNQWVYDGFAVTYKSIGVEFDQYYYESNTYMLGKDIVQDGLEKGVFYKKEDNSVWVDLEPDGLDNKLVQRGDGTSVYITQDMGTADLKYKDYAVEKSIYVVGNEQDYHFQVLKLIMQKLGRSYADGIYHLSYGMVDLPSGKMKSREGTVVDADDLIEEMVTTAQSRTEELGKIDGFSKEEANTLYQTLGLGALKYYILKVDPKKRMLFNPEESIDFQGNTGPFIQYTHARIKSLIRRAEKEGVTASLEGDVNLDAELQVLALLTEFPKKIQEAGRNYSPAIVANFVFELCKEFNRYYAEVPLFKEETKAQLPARIAFCTSVAKVIKISMNLLGVEVPEKM